MTPRQRDLARCALGLGIRTGRNKTVRSYRNRFFASIGHADYEDWKAMVAAGEAEGLGDPFWLTRAGAEAALNAGESLDPEDFPEVSLPAGEKAGWAGAVSPLLAKCPGCRGFGIIAGIYTDLQRAQCARCGGTGRMEA